VNLTRVPVCHRCGVERDYVTVRNMAGDVWYWPSGDCECPGPRCPFCQHRIDQPTATTSPGECPNPACFLWTHLVPIPAIW
jgi:hypothetical protein